MERVGFIGLGMMGSRMAKNILKAGCSLTVYNRTLEKAKPFEALGAKVASSPEELAESSNVVITMLRDSPTVEFVLLGDRGAFHGARPGTLFIDMSTVLPETPLRMAKEAAQRGLRFIEAPVIGGISQAEEGSLTILVGGSKEDLERARPILQAMGKQVYHVGDIGSGAKLKLVNNMLLGVFAEALAEAFRLASGSGLDMGLVVEVLSQGILGAAVKGYAPRILGRQYQTRFKLELMLKDLRYALKVAHELNLPMPTLSGVAELYQMASSKGLGQADYTAVAEVLF